MCKAGKLNGRLRDRLLRWVLRDEDGDPRQWDDLLTTLVKGLLLALVFLGAVVVAPSVGSLLAWVLREQLESLLGAVFLLWVVRVLGGPRLHRLRGRGSGGHDELPLYEGAVLAPGRAVAGVGAIPPWLERASAEEVLSPEQLMSLEGVCQHEAAHAAVAVMCRVQSLSIRIHDFQSGTTSYTKFTVEGHVDLAFKRLQVDLAGRHWESSRGLDLMGSASDYEQAAGCCVELVDFGEYPSVEAALAAARAELEWKLNFASSGILRLSAYLMEHRSADDATIRQLFEGSLRPPSADEDASGVAEPYLEGRNGRE